MKNKRKFKGKQTTKVTAIDVVIENLDNHPLCLHGPTLLFSNNKCRYFSCSSCRNKTDCTVHISEDDWRNPRVKELNKKYEGLIPKIDKVEAWENYVKITVQPPSDRAYCYDCDQLYSISQVNKHKDHRMKASLSDEQLAHPTSWLPTLENNSVEAQYIFGSKSIATILHVVTNNNIGNILCIGTPSIHETIQEQSNLKSLLLDYDKRHHQFYPPNKFIWYNMFNNFLFNGDEDEKVLRDFFKNSSTSGLCVVIDPPFGGRVEPLVQTLQTLNNTYKKISKANKAMAIIWAFPYFSEPYIQSLMPGMLMHDYQVEYENHTKFQNSNKGRKFGSPVRLFTNLPLDSIDLSNDKNYKYCEKCKYWVTISNSHCMKCNKCPSKNGMTYNHCDICNRCVKPTFFHCKSCKRCCQQNNHECGIIVKSKTCYNCQLFGHKKSECPKILNDKGSMKKRKKI